MTIISITHFVDWTGFRIYIMYFIDSVRVII